MTQELEWIFEKQPRMGGASSGSWHNPLAGSGLTRENVLAREAIQNSCDAEQGGNGVELWFRKRTVSRVERDGLVEALGIKGTLLERRDLLGLNPGNTLEHIAKDDQADIELLYIEDFGTKGLGGRLLEGDSVDDRFRRLCLWIGVETSESALSGRGGTFGYGKTVYAGASDIKTVAFYSVFEPGEETGGTHARLFVCSFYFSHQFQEERFTGRAWFGIPGQSMDEAWPAEDDEAHVIAHKLGFTPRSEEDCGTSVLIIGTNVSMEGIKEGAENFWWPRLIDTDLTVILKDNDNDEITPAPRQREDLRPFVRCYDLFTGRIPNLNSKIDSRPRLNAFQSRQLGTLILTKGDEIVGTSEEQDDDEVRTDSLHNAVALMRGQRMVAEYRKTSTNDGPSFNGIFFAHHDSQDIFALSEPPAHNRWDAESSRLDGDGRQLVRRTLGIIQRRAREFQNSLRPDIPLLPSGLRMLERELARFLNPSGLGPRPSPPRTRDPFEIHIEQERVYEDGMSSLVGQIRVKLKPDFEQPSLKCRVGFEAYVVADDNRVKEARIAISSLECDLPMLVSDTGENAHAILKLAKGSQAKFSVRTDVFDSELDLDFALQVESYEPLSEQNGEKES